MIHKMLQMIIFSEKHVTLSQPTDENYEKGISLKGAEG